MSKYVGFDKIKLEDTVIVSKTKRGDAPDKVFEQLRKNKINNLKELFEADDEQNIQYGDINSSYNIHYRTKGTVKLLRYKYLGEDIPYIDVLDGKIINEFGSLRLLRKGEDKPLNLSIIDYLCVLGLSTNFARGVINYINSEDTIISLLNRIYIERPVIICGESDYLRNLGKIRLIIDWYKVREDYRSNVYTIEEAHSRLVYLQNKLEQLQSQRKDIEQQIDDTLMEIERVNFAQEDIIKRARRLDE